MSDSNDVGRVRADWRPEVGQAFQPDSVRSDRSYWLNRRGARLKRDGGRDNVPDPPLRVDYVTTSRSVAIFVEKP
jgi:hypothetical protein